MNHHKLVAFIATAKPEESVRFYTDVLSLHKTEDTPFATVYELGVSTLRIQKLGVFAPAAHTVLGWEVADLDATMADYQSRGVSFERFTTLPQDDQGVWQTPDGSRVCWFKDPDGNVLSLTERA